MGKNQDQITKDASLLIWCDTFKENYVSLRISDIWRYISKWFDLKKCYDFLRRFKIDKK